MNLIERALAQAASLPIVRPGDRLLIHPAMVFIPVERGLSIVRAFHEAGYKQVVNQEPIVFGIDEKNPQPDILRFCRTHQLRVEEHLSQEKLPTGAVFASTSGPSLAVGALGLIPLPLSAFELAQCLGTGSVEWFVPETVYIEITDRRNIESSAKQVMGLLMSYFQADGLSGKAVVIGGNVISTLSIEERIQLAQRIPDMGGGIGIIDPLGPRGQVEKIIKLQVEESSKL